jgi:GDPmannose 4,6-dehydratase
LIRCALITGISGQDGSYLADLLLRKNYEVRRIKLRAPSFNIQRIDHIYEDPQSDHAWFWLRYSDPAYTSNFTRILQEMQPDAAYNSILLNPLSSRRGEALVPVRSLAVWQPSNRA